MQREITQEMAKDCLPRREADANKGSFGSVLAAAGSMAYGGAAALHRGVSAPGRALSTWPAGRW